MLLGLIPKCSISLSAILIDWGMPVPRREDALLSYVLKEDDGDKVHIPPLGAVGPPT